MSIARRTQARAMRCVGGVLLIVALPAGYAQYTRLPDIQIPDFRHAPPPAAARAGSAETCATCGVITAIRETQSQRPVAVPQGFQNAPSSSGPTTDFRVGAVVLEGIELCEPCRLFKSRTDPRTLDFFVRKGGLRTRVISGGVLEIGATIDTVG